MTPQRRDALRAEYTFGSLFTGIGGIDLAFEREGFEIAFQVEIDDYCNKVLAKHWPNVKRYGDIRTVTDLPAVDVLAGGFPCQDISNAGKRAGIKEGNRSGLWFEFARLIGEIRPRFVLLENVAAITARDGSRVVADLAALGYGCEWGIVAASSVGAPHRRERWWCVAYRNDSFAARTDDTLSAGRHSVDACRTASVKLAYANENGRRQEFPRDQDGVAECSINELAYTQRDSTQLRYGLETSSIKNENDGTGTSDSSAFVGHTAIERLSGTRQPGNATLETQDEAGLVVQFERPSGVGQADAKEPGLENVIDEQTRPGFTSLDNWQTVSILGRAVDGLSRQLDGSRWPARPGQKQYPWEAPRTVPSAPNRASRLKALGNAVVPAVVQPFAAAIYSVLTEQDSRPGAE